MSSKDLIAKGYEYRRANLLTEAHAAFTEALGLCRSQLAEALCGLGQIHRDWKETAAALKNYEEAAAIYRELNDPLRLAHTVRHVADILRQQARLREAELHYIESLSIYRDHPDTVPLDLANALRGFALLKEQLGSPEEAIELWQEAKPLYAAEGIEPALREIDVRIAALNAR